MHSDLIECFLPQDLDLLVDNLHKVVGMSVHKQNVCIQGWKGRYVDSSLSGGNWIFSLNIVRKIERVSDVSTFRLQTVERIKFIDFSYSLNFCTQSLKREVGK